MPISNDASPLVCGALGGETLRCCCCEVFGGRCETQSWTRRLTLGFEIRLRVLREDGFVVIMMTGPVGRDGRRGMDASRKV